MKRILLLVTVTSMLAAALALSGVAQAQSDPEPPCGTAVADQYCIDKTATPGTVAVGDQITFTIRQRCPGNPQGCLAFAQAPIVDTLPSGLTDVSYPAACTQSGNTLTCAENRFFTETQPYTLTIVATTTECGEFTNTASYVRRFDGRTFTANATYTVECPPPLPTMKEQCKNGGWRDFDYPNQGTCISDVNRRNR
jgi:Domain of unknown function DUF11